MSATETPISTSTPIYKTIYVKVIAAILVLYCLIWLFSSPLIKYFAKEPLADMGVLLSENSQIRFNPFLTRISITDLALLKKDKTVFSIQNLALQVALRKVPFDTIEIEEFAINGITVDVKQEENTLFVAGIDLSTKEETVPAEDTPTEKTEPSSYKVILKSLKLTNANVSALLEKNPHTFNITELYINNIEASQLQQSAGVILKSSLDSAPLNLNANLSFNNGDGVIESTTSLSQFPLAGIKHLITPITALEGAISFSSKQTIKIDKGNIAVSVAEAKLLNNKLQLNTDKEAFTLDELTVNINNLLLSLTGENIDVSVEKTTLLNNNLLASSNENTINHEGLALTLDDLSLSLINKDINIKIAKTELLNKPLSLTSGENAVKYDELTLNVNDLSLSMINDALNVALEKTVLFNKALMVNSGNNKIQHDELSLNTNNLSLSKNGDTLNVSIDQTKLFNKALDVNADTNNIKHDELTLNVNQLLLSIIDNTLNVATAKTELINKALLVKTPQNTINLEELAFNANDLSLQLLNNELNDMAGITQLALTNASILGENNNQHIIGFKQLNVSNLSPSTIKNNEKTQQAPIPKATIDALTINELMFSQNKTNDLPAIAKIKQIIVKNIEGDTGSVAINSIGIDSITSHIILNKEKALANLVALSSSSTKSSDEVVSKNNIEQTTTNENNTAKKVADSTPDSTPFLISLNEFNLINKNEMYFVDNSVSPAYKRSLMIDELAVGALSNHQNKKEEKTSIKLLGRSNQYTNFDFTGFIQPFAAKQTYYVKGKLKELSLPDVSTYMKNALQLELTSGQLNTDLEVTLVDDNIDGEVSFNIAGLETGSTDQYEGNIVKSQVRIPLNAALGMLKDSKGNLELDIPLSGKTSDPSFGINSFIALITKKAVMSATESYLMKTFVPYANVVSVAMVAGEFILKLRFEDLAFAPTQLELNEVQNEYINEFIALMKDKKDTQVKLCSISTPADIGLTPDTELTQDDANKIKALGIQRGNNFKTIAVEAGIESGRMLLCSPQIDRGKTAVPRLTISV